MLRAGVDRFHELGLADVLGSINATSVTADLPGRGEGSFYYQFGSQQQFVEELIDFALAEAGTLDVRLSAVADALTEYAEASGAHLVTELQRIANLDFDVITSGSDLIRFELALWLSVSEPAVGDRLRARHGANNELLTAGYQLVLDRWDREPRPPFTMELIATVFAALVESLALRHGVDSDRVPASLFGHSVLALLPGMTRRRGDDTDLHGFLARFEVRDWHSDQPLRSDARRERSRLGSLTAALALAEEHGFEDLTVERIAAAADVNPSTIYDHFGSKAGLGSAAFLEAANVIEGEVVGDLAGDRPGYETLEAALLRLVEVCKRYASVFSTMLGAAAGAVDRSSAAGLSIATMSAWLVPAIERAQAQGSLRADVPAAEAAMNIITGLFIRLVVDPRAEPERHVEHVRRTLVEGLAPR